MANAGQVVRRGAFVLRPSNPCSGDGPRVPAGAPRDRLRRWVASRRGAARWPRAAGLHRGRRRRPLVPDLGADGRGPGIGHHPDPHVPPGVVPGRDPWWPLERRVGRPRGRPHDLPQRRLPREHRLPRRGGRGAAGLRLRSSGPTGPRPRRLRPDVRPRRRRPQCPAPRVGNGRSPGPPATGRRHLRARPRPARDELLWHLDRSMDEGGSFVRRRVEAGDPNFIRMLASMDGMERYERRRRWWEASRADVAGALA